MARAQPVFVSLLAGLAFGVFTLPAQAEGETAPNAPNLSFKECGARYQAAKKDGSLGGQKWTDFRRDICGIAASPAKAASPEDIARLVFPASIDAEFSAAKPWEARMRTCLKGYREAKQSDRLYGVKWVEKGGGYYSLCSARLRGAAKPDA